MRNIFSSVILALSGIAFIGCGGGGGGPPASPHAVSKDMRSLRSMQKANLSVDQKAAVAVAMSASLEGFKKASASDNGQILSEVALAPLSIALEPLAKNL